MICKNVFYLNINLEWQLKKKLVYLISIYLFINNESLKKKIYVEEFIY